MSTPEEEFVRRHLTDAVRKRIEANVRDGTVPPTLRDLISALPTAEHRGSAPLESLLPSAALEAIVRLTGRPPLLVKNGEIILEPLDDFPVDVPDQIRALTPWLASVGRVEFRNHSMSWGGTGWVIDHDGDDVLIVTNRHVASLVARRGADGRGVFLRSAGGSRFGLSVDFGAEVTSCDDDDSRTLFVTGIDLLADALEADVALLRVAGAAFRPAKLGLADTPAKMGQPVALVGYPAYDSRNDASAQNRYFRDIYEVKRVAPGFIVQAQAGGSSLMHDCTSLGGNSGSPLICLETRKVVGLHFAGVYGRENSAVSAETLRRTLDGERLVAIRQGQPMFRMKLMDAYERRCAITGCEIEDTLQAAHISPYRGDHTNHVTNGLLLRADIHTLFDRGHIRVDRNFRIVLSDAIRAAYPGLPETIRLPAVKTCWPNREALQQKFRSR